VSHFQKALGVRENASIEAGPPVVDKPVGLNPSIRSSTQEAGKSTRGVLNRPLGQFRKGDVVVVSSIRAHEAAERFTAAQTVELTFVSKRVDYETRREGP